MVQSLINRKLLRDLLTFFVTESTCGLHVSLLSSITPRFTTVSLNGTLPPSCISIPGKFYELISFMFFFEPKKIALVLPGLRRRPELPAQSETSLAASASLAVPEICFWSCEILRCQTLDSVSVVGCRSPIITLWLNSLLRSRRTLKKSLPFCMVIFGGL